MASLASVIFPCAIAVLFYLMMAFLQKVVSPDSGRPLQRLFARPEFVAFLLILVATAVLIPIFINGFPRGSDAIKHYRWSVEFIEELRDGVLFPRWLSEANRGMGSPAFDYYPPLPFYVVAAFNLITKSGLGALTLGCWLALALSGLTMYKFSRLLLPRGASLSAAVIYMIIPYHVFDLYEGSALSEFWSFVWVPLFFEVSFRVIKDRGWSKVPYLGLSYAALLLTHVPLAFITTLALAIYALMLTREVRRLLRVAAGLALGAALSAFFILPVLFERGYVQINRLLRHDYNEFFIFENLRSALNLINQEDEQYEYIVAVDLVAFSLLVLLVASFAALWNHWRSRQKGESSDIVLRAVVVITLVSLLMATRLTRPIWSVAPGLAFLQFPFRWLVITSVGASLLAAAAIRSLMRSIQRNAGEEEIGRRGEREWLSATVAQRELGSKNQKPETRNRKLTIVFASAIGVALAFNI